MAGIALWSALLGSAIAQTPDSATNNVTDSLSTIASDSLSTRTSDSLSKSVTDSVSKSTKDSVSKNATVPFSQTGFTGAPYVQYAPETGWAGGLAGQLYFHLGSDTNELLTRPSDLSAGGMYSQKNQYFVGLNYDLYFARDAYHLGGGFHYEEIPLDFYGVGNYSPVGRIDNYTPRRLGTEFNLTKNIFRSSTGEGLNAGIEGEFRHDEVRKSDTGGLIATGREPGAHGGYSCGAGVILRYDTRDNIYSTHDGEYEDVEAVFYGRALGSDFTFNRYTLDLRRFVPLAKDQTLATQFFAQFADGTEPFYEMGGLGGDSKLRGYYLLRFRENDVMLLQTEYRFPIWWRFGGVVFAGAGEVGHVLSDFTARGIHPSGGAGLRLLVVPAEHLSARLDYGIGTDSKGLYISIQEAF